MDKKIKVLWFCSAIFSDIKSNSSGTWLHTMANALISTGAVQLYNITQARVKDATRQDSQLLNQWLMPYESLKNNGLPSSKTIQEIQKIVDEIKPDVIQVWGTEACWGLLSARGYIKGNIILEIQGLKFAVEKHFFSGLSCLDILKCCGLKEYLKPSVSLIGLKRSFKRWGKYEKEMLLKHKVISTQSEWVRAYVKTVNPSSRIFNTNIALRNEFIETERWNVYSCVPYQVFTSSSFILSYKGLHILIDAIAILKKRYSEIKLCIAGSVLTGLRQDGYSKWLMNKIKRLGLEKNITWLGALDANELVLQMHNANVVVVPSFVETYCVALDEALTVGVPTVVSFSGAMPELAIHKKTALFFPSGDTIMCANAIDSFFQNKEYADEISRNAYNDKKSKKNNNIASPQLDIYKKVINEQ